MNRNLLIDVEGAPGLFCVFEEDEEHGGQMYLYQPEGSGIIRHLKIYDLTLSPLPDKEEIEVMWSSDRKKCGVAIWGRMRGIMNIVCGEDLSIPLETKESPAIVASEWLAGFDDYLDQTRFITARKRHWKEMARQYRDQDERYDTNMSENQYQGDDTESGANFLVYSHGPNSFFAVFEDDARVGHFYLYDSKEGNVIQDLQIYVCSERLQVHRDDIRLAWSESGSKCGVIIWDKMRGIIDRVKKREGRVKLEDRSTPGIGDSEWLTGFEYLYS